MKLSKKRARLHSTTKTKANV